MLRLATLCRNSLVRFVLCKLWNGSLASAQAKTRAPNKTRALRQRTKAFQKIPSSLLDGSQTETSPARTRTAALYLRFPDFGFTITSMPRRASTYADTERANSGELEHIGGSTGKKSFQPKLTVTLSQVQCPPPLSRANADVTDGGEFPV